MKTCRKCQTEFTVTDQDREFYAMISPTIRGQKFLIPDPTLCPPCRAQRRYCFRNERSLCHRSCDLCRRPIIALYSPDKPFTVYCYECYWSDTWDGISYGRPYDPRRNFFEQFKKLWKDVPLIALWNSNCENAEFNNNCFELKNSYMSFNCDFGENVYYCYISEYCKECVDCTFVHECELCYECVDSRNCYQCFFSRELVNSSDCYFSTDLVGCRNCFGCHGLRQKQYYLFNKPVSSEEWKKFMSSFRFTEEKIVEAKKRSEQVRLDVPKKAVYQVSCEDAVGDHLFNCRRMEDCFDIINGEDLNHVTYGVFRLSHVQDSYAVGDVDWAYEFVGGGLAINQVAFIFNTTSGLSNSYYCVLSGNSSDHLFGCVGLQKKKYCILNQQYSKNDYEQLLSQILEDMKKNGEWGEFFPKELSPFGYNETIAEEFSPLGREKALEQGFHWSDYETPSKITGENTVICEKSGRPFRYTPQELNFYRRFRLPFPKKHPLERHRDRMHLRNPRQLWTRSCGKCQATIKTSFHPDRPEKVYCERCYLRQIY